MPGSHARLPGFVNAHSHAFQRRLRGLVERVDPANPADDFWTWREAMYAAAGSLDPDSIHHISRLAFEEMVGAGYVAVGEFHYPHHQPDGSPYPEPNVMATAVAAAARDAGIELVLLMTAYERAGAGKPPTAGQRRFCDPSVAAYLERVEALASAGVCRVGVAPHSVRAVSREWLAEIARYADASGMVVHIHACEQRRELEECQAEYGMLPVELLADAGVLGPRATVVHATHITDRELDLLADSDASVCACPTTEANLGDGYLPAARLFERGIRVCIGSDSNTVIDPLVELREIEAIARRQAERRNVLVRQGDDGPTPYLIDVGTVNGAHALGISNALPEIEVDRDHPQLREVAAAHLSAALIFGGSAAALHPATN
jgi:formimidoylglutamate deiminase